MPSSPDAPGSATSTAAGPAEQPPTGTALVYDSLAVRGHATGDPSGIFPTDPAVPIFPGVHYENWLPKLDVWNLLDAVRLTRHLRRVEARRATREELLRVHTAAHVDAVNEASAQPRGALFGPIGDTVLGHDGHVTAELAAGGAVELAMAVWQREVRNGYALMRPPGHHATRDEAMGFCIYNNLAVAAAALLAAGAERLLVLDWDIHTGNGTQDVFGQDERVVIVDMHQRECFPPGAGHIEERGVGNILNLDIPPGLAHETALYAMDRVVLPAMRRHDPQVVLVASGCDSALTDPLGRAMLSPATYRAMTRLLLEAADTPACQGRIAMFHEGGYDPYIVPECVLAILEELSGVDTGRPSQFDPVAEWMSQGHTPSSLAALREPVDAAAALVAEIPPH